MMKHNIALSCLIFIFLLLVPVQHGASHSFIYQPVEYNSDGSLRHVHQPSEDQCPGSCQMKYGFIPCANRLPGYIFEVVLYEYLLFRGASFVSAGNELIFEILGPNVFGSSVFRILGAIPKSLIVLASVLSQGKEKAENKVMVGMGTLAGSTTFLLTLLWGSCVIAGKSDLADPNESNLQDTKGLSLVGSGVKTDRWTTYAARIMATSVIPLMFVQIRMFYQSSSGRSLATLVALISCILLLVSYSIYQFFHPWIQKRSLEYVKRKHVISGLLRHFETRSLGRLLTDDGDINRDILRKLFRAIDLNGDGRLSDSELRALIVGIQFEEINLDHNDAVRNILIDVDTSGDSHVDEDEFVKGVSKWLDEAKRSIRRAHDPDSPNVNIIDHFHKQTKEEQDLLDYNERENTANEVEKRKQEWNKAIFNLVLGIAISSVCAGPLVDAVNSFSTATSIPSFFTSFVAVPFATNLKGAVSALAFVRKKKRRNASLAFSEIYGAVVMNNTLSFAVFLAVVYINSLSWDFSAEVWVIIGVCTLMSLFASFSTSYPLWTSIIAVLLYPLSLMMVYVQKN